LIVGADKIYCSESVVLEEALTTNVFFLCLPSKGIHEILKLDAAKDLTHFALFKSRNVINKCGLVLLANQHTHTLQYAVLNVSVHPSTVLSAERI
jgi:hypothetical protein